MRNFKGCDKCRNNKGYYIVTLEDGEEVAKKCRCLKVYERGAKVDSLMRNAGIPEHITDYSLNQYVGEDKKQNLPKVRKYVDEFESRYRNTHLYIYGPYGTQKTTVVLWMARQLLSKGVNVIYITMNNLLTMLMDNASFDKEKSRSVDLTPYETCDLLILDESFDKKKMTWYASDYQMPFLDSFLRERIESRRVATVFVSNTPPQEIATQFDQGLKELILRNTVGGWLPFNDHYSLVDDFDPSSMWS